MDFEELWKINDEKVEQLSKDMKSGKFSKKEIEARTQQIMDEGFDIQRKALQRDD